MQKLKSKKSLILYGCSGLGVNMLNIIVGTYLCSALLVGGFEEHVESWTFLNKDLVVSWLWIILGFFAKALDGIIDLPLATFADKLNTKLGRRKTAILIGIIPMLIAYLLFLVPLNDGETILNTVWFGALLCVFYTCYTLTMLTYYATFAEVCETEKETALLSTTKSICDVVYFSLGFALLPVFISLSINIRIIALIFLPLVLTMVIPFFLLKEDRDTSVQEKPLTLRESISVSLKNKRYMYWLITASIMTIGLQLFLGGINELFSNVKLDMSVVMASSFAPVPFTLILYNKIKKRFGFADAFRYSLVIFAVGMLIMFACSMMAHLMTSFQLTLVAILGGVFVSFSLGALFSVNYSVPTFYARKEYVEKGLEVSGMYFAVQGLFEGIAYGLASYVILTSLKELHQNFGFFIKLLPIIVAVCCMAAFFMSYAFDKELAYMDKEDK